ncbi:clumping factor A [Drosophila rhopaloa]|uniref:Uncharacterized protein n=1 Tax=Drosophila rhopaloa TaxID=1041015 RepID=A0ABM5HVN1_DRORH|nr:clumping factor A [Drosophila rhopaloa]
MDIGAECRDQTHSQMAGDAAKSKRAFCSSTQVQLDMEKQMENETWGTPLGTNLVEDDADFSSSSSEPTSSGGTDSEANSTSDPDADGTVCSGPFADLQSSTYTPLAGDSDNDLDEEEVFCEEAISLLAHEILCCECESDSESEAEGNGEDTGEAKDNGKLSGIHEYGLHNPYQLMFSEEDDENPSGEDSPIVSETILLLGEDQQSEDKPESKKEESFL